MPANGMQRFRSDVLDSLMAGSEATMVVVGRLVQANYPDVQDMCADPLQGCSI